MAACLTHGFIELELKEKTGEISVPKKGKRDEKNNTVLKKFEKWKLH